MSLRQSAVKQKMQSNDMERLACGREEMDESENWRKLTIYGTMRHVDLLMIVVLTIASARRHTVTSFRAHLFLLFQ